MDFSFCDPSSPIRCFDFYSFGSSLSNLHLFLSADALVRKCFIFCRFCEFRSLAQDSCASLCSLSEPSELIGIFFKAHVLEKYGFYNIKTASCDAVLFFCRRFAFDRRILSTTYHIHRRGGRPRPPVTYHMKSPFIKPSQPPTHHRRGDSRIARCLPRDLFLLGSRPIYSNVRFFDAVP